LRGASTKKRAVYVNGVYCESLTAGATEATRVLGREVAIWQIQRAMDGDLIIFGIDISEKPPVMHKPVVQEQITRNVPLLRYRFKERPLDRGITRVWQ